MSRSLVEHQAVPFGCIARPTQLRMPVANSFWFLPSGSKASTAARSVSVPQDAPSGCCVRQASSPPGGVPIRSATLLAEPTDTSIRLSSGVKTMSRVEWL